MVDNLINTVKTEANAAALVDEQPEPFVLEELTINYAEHRVTVAGSPVRLTSTKYRLLQELPNNTGQVLTQERLLRRVWGQEYPDDTRLRTPTSTTSAARSGTTPGVPPTFLPSPGWGTGWPSPETLPNAPVSLNARAFPDSMVSARQRANPPPPEGILSAYRRKRPE